MHLKRDARSAKGIRHVRSSGRFGAISAAIVVLIAATASITIWSAREHAFTEYQESATNLTAVLAEQTARYVQVVDLAMMVVQSAVTELNDVPYPQFKIYVESDEMHRRLIERMVNVPQAGGIALVGADGSQLEHQQNGAR